PSTEDNLLTLDHKRLAAALHFNAYGTLPTEQDATRQTAGLAGEIAAVRRQAQVAQRRAVPNAVGVIQRIGAYASGVRMVVVGISREASSQARLIKRCLLREEGIELVFPP